MLVLRNANARVTDREGDDFGRRLETEILEPPALFRPSNGECDVSLLRELEGIGQEVLEHLLQPSAVGVDRRRKVGVELHVEAKALLFRQRVEASLDELLDLGEANIRWIDVHLAGLDLRQIEHVVDKGKQIAARGENRLGELHLLRSEVAVLVLAEKPREDEEAVERSPQLVRHVRQEFRFVLGAQRELVRLFFESEPC